MSEKKYDILVISEANNYLCDTCDKVKTKEEGEQIAKDLFRTLSDLNAERKDHGGIGLAAPQIGIRKRVCVINVKEPLYFINPVMTPVKEAGTFVYLETCLSMPGYVARTERWRAVTIKDDTHENEQYYDISDIPQEFVMQSADAYEMACIQHEIDHLDGKLISDRIYVDVPTKVTERLGRNNKVTIRKGLEVKEIKYKKLDEYKHKGWILDTGVSA
jgi:peptide deformylase